MVPTLTTARLLLDAHREADLDAAAALWADPAVVRHIGGRPFTREEVWHRLQRYVGHWSLKGYGLWAVRLRESGRFVGEVGFADFKRPLTPPIEIAPEAGWVMATETHGSGIANEALTAALGWADSRALGTISALIAPENVASLRLAARHGFAGDRRVTYHGRISLLLTRPGGG
ncbi:GNAT family N-acetyltransferase [Sphingomonas jatrophae]|uniref:Protein N-acetyltransferase, RimJ/RimL family n=1 Tax=Sphingomonas jatrophae TaxID=1166337 RepID=A0A1I6JNW4_9SPHN|nr:GNAT family N-acetyltransferase [Sphingomonas jatrophae]SFR80644.1 Protein N-acetyltransferase, RimJ/RimL family [Sphingomonas jatrophae]